MHNIVLTVLFVSFTLVELVYSASDGSFPESSCTSMTPTYRRNIPPQPNTDADNGFAGPVELYLEFGDRSKNVTIYTKDANERFIGFMLQIRYDDERYDTSIKPGPVGEFTVHSNDPFKCMDCTAKCDSITHKGNNPKQEITVKWTKPLDYAGENLYLRYSIVMENSQYWVGIEYPPKEETHAEIERFQSSG